VYVRGKYRDVILPFTVLRRLDAVLEATKDAVLERKQFLDTHKWPSRTARCAWRQARPSTTSRPSRCAKLKASAKASSSDDFIAYLDGFSPNVQEILTKFKFRNQIPSWSRPTSSAT
jgi:type I restriction enzyme M protein